MRTTLATIAAAGLAISATSVQAKSVSVSYSDLNLGTASGQKALSQRIDKAARKVCGHESQRTGSRLPDHGARACFEEAKTRATEQFAARSDMRAMGG